MKSAADKIILVFSILCLLDLFIIGNVLFREHSQAKVNDTNYLTYANQALPKPKTGFTELIAQAQTPPQVLSVSTEATPTPLPLNSVKETYKIAIIGDSMVETMGDSIDYVKASLKKKYPKTNFVMYNYGVGSENITMGLERLDKPFDHQTRHYPPLAELKPDILIVGSYAYNPLVPFDKDLHAQKLAGLVNKARQVSAKVYMFAEIAPVEVGFGTGPGGVNWPADLALTHVQKITAQMENVFLVGKNLSVPVIDVYTKSQKPGYVYGKVDYVSTHDHIHTSLLGQTFTADIITESLSLN